MAKRRKTVGYSDADSGLECKVSLKWCEWEQKFISGIDPTLHGKIIAMVKGLVHQGVILMDYLKNLETKLKTWINTTGQIVTDMIQWISDGISEARDVMVGLAQTVLNAATNAQNEVVQ
jgi:hypothetical protein